MFERLGWFSGNVLVSEVNIGSTVFYLTINADGSWCRMITGGEDALYIARRLVVVASEDVGLADNHALPLVS